MTSAAACQECSKDAVPGFDRCYGHLGWEERAQVIRSDDPDVRRAATGHWRQGKVAAPPPRPTTTSSQIVCPHCQVAGKVTSERVRVKRGVSGGKATGAILTGGLSMLGTGLSRKQMITSLRCGNCRMTWTVD